MKCLFGRNQGSENFIESDRPGCYNTAMNLGHMIYTQNLKTLSLLVLLAFLAWGALCWFFGRKKLFRIFCIPLSAASVLFILLFTVLRRRSGGTHTLVFSAAYTSEFFRELFMNGLLYFPLGLALSVLLGPWAIVSGFALSLCIESCQYIFGTGLAQVTDVLMNTLGCFLGTLPYLLSRQIRKKKDG